MAPQEQTTEPAGAQPSRAAVAILKAISDAFPVPSYLPADAKTKSQKKRLKKLTKKILLKSLALSNFL